MTVPTAIGCTPVRILATEPEKTLMTIANLTQHHATAEQISDGVVDLRDRSVVQRLLTFETTPTRNDLEERAAALANLARDQGFTKAMIGGAPYLMAPLEAALRRVGIKPLYAFSVRESVDEPLPGVIVPQAVV